MKRIALIGNTCNNNFAMLRYFRDLGYETDLFLFSNEGHQNENPIHNPEWDTWEINNWNNYIYRLNIPNGIETVIGRPDKFKLPPNLICIKNIFENYKYFIGSGITPSLFVRMNKKLNIFYPYSTGIEWVNESENLKKLRTFNLEWPFRKYILHTQLKGINNSLNVLSHGAGNNGINAKIYNKYNIKAKYIHTPQYYNREIINKLPSSSTLIEIRNKFHRNNFNIFSFMRQLWVYRENEYPLDTWDTLNKHNDWLIKGFHNLINISDNIKAKLFLSSVGPDINDSKKLINDLNLNNHVVWIPLLARREVTYILNNYADLAVGQFVCSPGETSGSTTWESVAAGIPLIDSFNFTNEEFNEQFGIKKPPFLLEIKDEKDVSKYLIDCFNNIEIYKTMAKLNKEWFDNFNGISLARKWLDILGIDS